MLLDKILAHLDVRVEAFALCDVREGWSLKLAPPPLVVLHFVLDGQGRLRVPPAGAIELLPNLLVVVPPGLAHSLDSNGANGHSADADSSQIPFDTGVHRIQVGHGGSGLLVACGRLHATYGGTSGLFDHLHEPLVHSFDDAPVMRASFEALLEEQTHEEPGGEALTAALMNQCFILLLRAVSRTSTDLAWMRALSDDRLGRPLEAILDHPENPHSVDSLAALAGMGRSSFTEHFARSFDRSPMDFVRETRLRRGARLLRTTDQPVKQIASRVGFNSRSHFSQAFAELYGCAPASYRAHAHG